MPHLPEKKDCNHMIKTETQDLRVKRTLRSIRTAFMELLQTEDFSKISITELTRLAGINRKTFYLHYKSLSELADELEAEMTSELMDAFQEQQDNSVADIHTCISVFYHFLDEGTPVQQKLLFDPEYAFFYTKFVNDILNTPYFQNFYLYSKHPSLVKAYCVSLTSMYRTWINDGKQIPLEELIEYVSELFQYGYSGAAQESRNPAASADEGSEMPAAQAAVEPAMAVVHAEMGQEMAAQAEMGQAMTAAHPDMGQEMPAAQAAVEPAMAVVHIQREPNMPEASLPKGILASMDMASLEMPLDTDAAETPSEPSEIEDFYFDTF